jgi:hypothetical protein
VISGTRFARTRLPPRTPWLYFHRDHPLKADTRRPPRRDRESYDDQADRLRDILALPDDPDEPPWYAKLEDEDSDDPPWAGSAPCVKVTRFCFPSAKKKTKIVWK